MYFQMENRMTVTIAHSGSADHFGRFSTPRPDKIMFTGPIAGLNRKFHTAVTATMDAT